MRCFLFSTVVVLVFLAGSVPAEDTKEDSLPVGVDTSLVSHVQENGLEQVMRVKRYCGCCGGESPVSVVVTVAFRMLRLYV